MMFKAFQNNGRPWARIQQQNTQGGDTWPYCCLDVCQAVKSCCNVT